ncbi:LysR family transcriptional regulator [Ralstonia pseudosolanacearum]|uniref:LysR family transcriptional regulator n=3 Tax=Ralstonia solanacearum species complex TaxID=3116862 RepID=A0A0S4WPG7_RALSL|nr:MULTISPECIES: LysR family transcriptional regulator [Ralstonia]AVV67748.1 LysR family transcriptional regulator [Ralstonia solanacearum OE1-1]KAF3460333.1 LysR family transcriptional regulator [Ralstonia solanacearum]API76088.1 LysR family transcriptional regulator [Ralstonia pseudosolanacearum]ASL73210.1 LysR family transcriptional regulator [Ralstonia pseudosolanacearum]AST87770.1 LysR family transcriptional regulator [Ralstonia pseudosolanacearum]
MRKLDLESLLFFKSVADLGSITQAARQLNRVQSNVTTRVKNLEERLGVKLFLRHGNRLTLSADGERLRGYAERLLRLSAEAESAMLVRAPQGTLKLGTLESTAAARLPPVLSQFHRRYPDVLIELVTGSSAKLLDMVQRYEVDAALISEPFHAPGLATQEAFDEVLVLIAPLTATHVLSHDHLQRCTVVAFSAGCSYRRIFEEWLASNGIAPARILELASYHAIVACVAAGTGIGIMPRSVLKAVHAEPQLQLLPLPPRYAEVKTHLVWQPDHDFAAVDALRQHLLEF